VATTAVDIVVKVTGQRSLDKITSSVKKSENAINNLDAKLKGPLNSSFQKAGTAGQAAGNKIKNAFRGAAKSAGALSKRLSQGLAGTIAKVSALAGAAISLSQAFRTIEQQDFAIAKVKSLGVNSEVLLTQLKEVSKELKGQASVAELTGAAYDVASAGFVNAADAAKVLKAASLGATAGFSDINTVANATTSVLNAYGLSADKAGKLVDGFVQTQNDGKIVISEYADNIGKLAPIAASLNVPLEEINGAIAAITANGVNAEIGITGIRSGLAKLGANSKEATETLAAYGLEINATTIANEGLVKTLEKLSKVSNQEDLLKIVGVEAGQAIQPLLNDLEKLNRLVANQADAFGVAQRGADVASNSIRGALKNVETQFTNLITSGQGISRILIPAFNGLAKVIEALNGPIGVIVGALGTLATAWFLVAKAALAAKSAQLAASGAGVAGKLGGIIASVAAVGEASIAAAKGSKVLAASITAANAKITIATVSAGLLKIALLAIPFVAVAAAIGGLAALTVKYYTEQAELNRLIRGGSDDLAEYEAKISELETELTKASAKLEDLKENGISNARAVNAQKREVEKLRSQLEQLEGTYDVIIRITSVESRRIPGRRTDAGGGGFFPFQKEADEAFNAATQPKIEIPKLSGGGGSGGGGGGGGGSAPKPQDDTKQAEAELRRLTQTNQLLLTRNQIDKDRLANQFELEDTLKRIKELEGISPDLRKQLEVQADVLATNKDNEIVLDNAVSKAAEAFQQAQDALIPLEQQKRLLEAQLNGTAKQVQLEIDIENATRGKTKELAKQIELRIRGNAALQEEKEKTEEINSLYKGIGDTIENGIIGAIDAGINSLVDGTKSLDKALQEIASGVLKDIGNQLIRFGVNAALSGLGNSGGFLGKLFGGGRAEGGSVSPDKTFLVGEKGPELFTPTTSGTIIPNDFFDSARAALQPSNGDSAAADNPEAFAAAAAAIQRNTTNINNRQSSVSQETSFNNFAETLGSQQRETIRFETVRVGEIDMVTKDEALKIGAESAKAAEASVFNALKNKPSVRKSIGMS